MVRVNGKPCLDYILEHAYKISNVAQTIIVDGKYDDIRNYCKTRYPDIHCVKQNSLNGPHDAICVGMDELKDRSLPLVIWLGDAIIIESNINLGDDFLLCKEAKDHHNWCMWDGETFYNKPDHMVPEGVALVGLYSFSDGESAVNAFMNTKGSYDISSGLVEYSSLNAKKFSKIITNKWYDIGDLPTYFKTCAELLTLKARAFHNIKYDSELGVICKERNSRNINTIRNEKGWYASLTSKQSMFVPKVLEHDSDLILSYESGTLLSDLMLYEDIRESTWEYIIDKLFRIKLNYFNDKVNEDSFLKRFSEAKHKMWVSKTTERIREVDGFDTFTQSVLINKAKEVAKCASPIKGMHGDLHFGNILYNQQTDQLKFIDPRGEYGHFSGVSYGDDIYDFAKLSHDLYHGYNAMVSNVPKNESVKSIFIKTLRKYSLPEKEIVNGGLVLLAACIPLHYDDSERQNRFTNYILRELH